VKPVLSGLHKILGLYFFWNRDSSVSIVTSIPDGGWKGFFSLHQCDQIGSEAHPNSNPMGTGSKEIGLVNTHFPLVPRLRMRGAMAWYSVKHKIHLYGVVLS
jgi:hypothetical protein